MIFETSFEDYDEADEQSIHGVAGKYDRFGNWRVNMPNHTAPFTHYDNSGVFTGRKSIHCWGEKGRTWGDEVDLRVPYGEPDMLTEQWLTPGFERTLLDVKDLFYNVWTGEPLVLRTEILDAVIADVLASEVGKAHWEGDWMTYDAGPPAVYGWDSGAPLLEPRSRLANNSVGSLTSAYQRIYFKPVSFSGCGMQILRLYSGAASDYVARVQVGPSELRLSAYGRDWDPNPIVGDVDVPISMTLGEWHVVELGFVKGASGNFSVWYGKEGDSFDLIIDEDTDTSSAPNIDSVQTGIVDLFDYVWGQSPPDDYAVADMYFDDWAIDTSHIGLLDYDAISIDSNLIDTSFEVRRIA